MLRGHSIKLDLCTQGALEMQKRAIQRQERKANSKEEIKTWMAQELEVLMATVEADYSLNKLMQDRASLVRQLEQLKKTSDPNEKELATITEFIDLRNIQIADLQQKILESDQGKISEIISFSLPLPLPSLILIHLLSLFLPIPLPSAFTLSLLDPEVKQTRQSVNKFLFFRN